MKKQLLSILLGLTAITAAHQSNAQSLVYYWDFNGSDTSMHAPHFTATGAGTATYQYWAAYTDFTTGSSVNIQDGDVAGNCLRVRNPADSIEFVMPTTGYKNVTFSYVEQKTNSGSKHNSVFYTVDGTNFLPSSHADATDSTTYTIDSTNAVTDSVIGWQLKSFSFSGDTMTNNNPHFAIRIVFVEGPDSTSGNNRFDNVALKGTSTSGTSSAVATVANAAATYILFPNPVTNMLTINSSVASQKSFTVCNAIGEKVAEGTAAEARFTINTSNFSAGNYYINIRENGTGNVTTMKFAK